MRTCATLQCSSLPKNPGTNTIGGAGAIPRLVLPKTTLPRTHTLIILDDLPQNTISNIRSGKKVVCVLLLLLSSW